MKKISEIRRAQRRRLLLPDDMVEGKKVVVWGAGVSGKNFIRINNHIQIDLVIDSRVEKQSSGILGHAVKPISDLHKFIPHETCVVLANEIHDHCQRYLSNHGYYSIYVPDRFVANHIAIYFDGINKKDFIKWINDQKINYILDRFKGNFSNDGDLDILVDLNGLELILQHDCARSEPVSNDSWALDIACGSPLGLENELMLYPEWVAREFLADRMFNTDYNAFTLSSRNHIVSILYHVFVHLGTVDAFIKYKSFFNKAFASQDAQVEAKLAFNFFLESSMFPGIDFLRKWVDYTDGDLIKECLPKKSKQSSIVYILRDGLSKIADGVSIVLHDLIDAHEVIAHEIFSKNQAIYVKERLRGGIWSDNNASKLGGDPLGYVYVNNNLSPTEAQGVKDAIRKKISDKFGQEINILHSSDDNIEAEYFLRIIEQAKQEV